MVKKIFKVIYAILMSTVNLIGMITIYTIFIALMYGSGSFQYHIPFTDDVKTFKWDNSNGN